MHVFYVMWNLINSIVTYLTTVFYTKLCLLQIPFTKYTLKYKDKV